MAAEVDVSCLKSTKQVFLANFSNGTLIDTAKKDVKFEIKEDISTDKSKRAHRTLLAETKKMKYIGENFGIYSCTAQTLSQYYIGVLNKKTGKMKVVEAPIMKLRPKLPGEEDSTPEIPQNLNLSFREKSDILTSAFGSSKKKRAMESRLRNQVKGEALEMALGEAVDHAMSNPNSTQVNNVLVQAETSSLIPPYDKDATSPADVYKLESIVTQAEIDSMSSSAQIFIDATREQIETWRSDATYAGYVLDHVLILPMREKERRYKASLVLYLQNMITLYQMKAAELRKKEPLPSSLPDIVQKSLLGRFTLKTGGDGKKPSRCMPARLKDKLVSYILVFCLILDEFHLDLGQVQADLKMGQQRMMTFVRALGCRYSTTKKVEGQTRQSSTARLEVPLTFPELTAKKQKNRR